MPPSGFRSAGDGGQALGRLRLRLDLQRVVVLVEETAQRDAQRQFDDLRLAEMLAQPQEQRVRDAARIFPGGDRVLDDKLVLFVELGVILIIEEPVRACRRYPL